MTRTLGGSWRQAKPAPHTLTTAELHALAGPAIASGVAALVRGRLTTPSVPDPIVIALEETAQRVAAGVTLAQGGLAHVVTILQTAGVQPLLFKGLAVGLAYGDPSMRPSGDLDLLVAPARLDAARNALAAVSLPRVIGGDPHQFVVDAGAGISVVVDLHAALPDSYAMTATETLARAVDTRIGDTQVRIPCPEDHLRLVILHFLRHGGWRPLWLCDVAALVEAAAPDFDVELFLTSSEITRGWLLAVIGAARSLLGCRVDHVPALKDAQAPPWLERAILREWRMPLSLWQKLRLAPRWRRPLVRIGEKWPNPIRAAFLRRQAVGSPSVVLSQLLQCGLAEAPTAMRTLARRLMSRLFSRLTIQMA